MKLAIGTFERMSRSPWHDRCAKQCTRRGRRPLWHHAEGPRSVPEASFGSRVLTVLASMLASIFAVVGFVGSSTTVPVNLPNSPRTVDTARLRDDAMPRIYVTAVATSLA